MKVITVTSINNPCYSKDSPYQLIIPLDRADVADLIKELAEFLRSDEKEYELRFSCDAKEEINI